MEGTVAMAQDTLTVAGKGLITGLPVSVTIAPGETGQGIVFHPEGASSIPARLEAVVNTERGVTLANHDGKTLSIVEHFLSACSLGGFGDLDVAVAGAPELPLLDGSAEAWLGHLEARFGRQSQPAAIDLPAAIYYAHGDNVRVYALPAPCFQVSYCLDYDHPDLKTRWVRWNSATDERALIANAQTFGELAELPALQARGLAMGVDETNTLGLTEDGGYTRPLKYADEPLYHKILDFIGDLTLAGVNPLGLRAHVFAINAGHGAHIGFANKLAKRLRA